MTRKESLFAGLQLMEIACGEMAVFTSSEGRNSFQALLQTEEGRQEIAAKFELLRQLLTVKSAEQFRKKVAEIKAAVETRRTANFKEVEELFKPIERRVRALQLLYLNAGTKPVVYILPIDAKRFVGAANPSHFNAMMKWLQKQFYSYEMKQTVSYVATTEIMETVNQALQMAKIAQEVKAIFFGNIMKFTDYRKLIQYLQRIFPITGIDPQYAHLVFPAVWGYLEGAFEDYAEIHRMSCPLGLAMLGKLLSVPPGEYISSLEKPPIDGIGGVCMEYDLETLDSKELQDLGVNMILKNGIIVGTTTANVSDNIDLQEYPTMDLINSIDRALVRFCNAKAHNKWGLAQADELKESIEIFFNGLASAKLIQEPTPKVRIEYDEKEQTVYITLQEVAYYRTASYFEITMEGKRDKGLHMMKTEN